jgi:Flp pilus assembly CpaE family ATPase
MPAIAVGILSEDAERLVLLQQRFESTHAARIVFAHAQYPATSGDQIVRRIQEARAEIVLVDLDPQSSRATPAIEIVQGSVANVAVFAAGPMNDPAAIVAAMRAGAREYLDRDPTVESLSEALARFAAQNARSRAAAPRARIIAVANSKGGAGATTVAVNTAVALEQAHGKTVLVDFGLLGHASLHLNARAAFGIADALQNLHRMDASLLQSYLTPCKGGMQLLAGIQQPLLTPPSPVEMARLFDLLVSQFQYVVLDCSNRQDSLFRVLADLANTVLLVAQTDVVSLWSAARLRTYIEQGSARDRVRIVLNRFKKIPGFTDEDVQKVTNCKLLWKLPNNFQAAGPAIDKGTPVAFSDANELGRSFRGLAAVLGGAAGSEDSMDLSFAPANSAVKKSAAGLLVTPLRANQ